LDYFIAQNQTIYFYDCFYWGAEVLFYTREREEWINKKLGSSGGLKSKKAGDGPTWWCHENDSSAARRVRADAGAARDGQARGDRLKTLYFQEHVPVD
jgi:hypothetical protein